MKSKDEGGYWPGFVDALTNVVFVMIIVVVVLMLMFMSTLLRVVHVERERAVADRAAAEAMHEKAVQEQQQQQQSQVLSAVPEKTQRQPTPAPAQTNNVALIQVTPVQKLKALSGDVAAEAAMVFISFPARESAVDERALAALKGQLASRLDEVRTNGISLRSDAVPPFVSEGRRLAYYRIVGIREWLLANGVASDKIDLRISDTPSVEGKQGVLVMSRPPAATATPALAPAQ